MKNKELELLGSEIEKAKNPKQQFNIYLRSNFAITENEYFLLEATRKFQELKDIKNEFQKLKHHLLVKENLDLRKKVIESIQNKLKTFNALRMKLPALNAHAAKVSVLYLKDDQVIDRLWQEGVASVSKDLNSLIWPPKLRKEKSNSVSFPDFVKILKLKEELSKISKLDEESVGKIISDFYFLEAVDQKEWKKNYIKERKKRFLAKFQASSNSINVIFSKSKKVSTVEAAQIYLENNPKLSALSARNIENAISEMSKSFKISLSTDTQKLHSLYYEHYWSDFVKNRSRPSSTKSWLGVSI